MTIGTSTSNNFTEGKNIGQKGFGDEISLSFLYYFPTHNKLVSVEQRDLKIYPNPANSNFRILLPIPSTTYKVFAEDVSGKLLNKWEVPEGSKYFDIDTSDWKSGSYIITCKGDGNNVYIKRIVKNN